MVEKNVKIENEIPIPLTFQPSKIKLILILLTRNIRSMQLSRCGNFSFKRVRILMRECGAIKSEFLFEYSIDCGNLLSEKRTNRQHLQIHNSLIERHGVLVVALLKSAMSF